MRTTIVAGISLLLGLTTASPVNQVTRLDTLAKRQFAAELTPQLSSGASVTFPPDSQWDNVTVRWNNYFPPTFRAAVQVANEADIVAVVKYATAHNISFFAQGGGHGFSRLDRVQNAIMIQMRHLNSIVINPQTGLATIGAATQYIEFIDAAYDAGREMTVGSCPCVGLTGAGLGGGIGRLQGMYGLSIDSFRRYRVVLASGEVINVTSTENPDLWWGIRGAGQNFGIVVESDVQTYPQANQGQYYNVDLTLTGDQVEAGFQVMNEQIRTMPAELAVEPAFIANATTLETTFTVNIVFSGNQTAGRQWSDPWKALNPVTFKESMISWRDLPTGSEGGSKNMDCIDGGFKDIYSGNIKEFDIPTMRTMYNSFEQFVRDNPNANQSTFLFEVYGQQGVRARPVDDSAFPGRNVMNVLPLIFGWWDDPSISTKVDAWLTSNRDLMVQNSGYDNLYIYENYANSESYQSYYGYEPWRLQRLQELKRKYDPTNQFFGYNPIPM